MPESSDTAETAETLGSTEFRTGSGRICLDFIRTLRWRGTGDALEELATPEALVAWIELVGPFDADTEISRPTPGTLRAAQETREAVYSLLKAARTTTPQAARPKHAPCSTRQRLRRPRTPSSPRTARSPTQPRTRSPRPSPSSRAMPWTWRPLRYFPASATAPARPAAPGSSTRPAQEPGAGVRWTAAATRPRRAHGAAGTRTPGDDPRAPPGVRPPHRRAPRDQPGAPRTAAAEKQAAHGFPRGRRTSPARRPPPRPR